MFLLDIRSDDVLFEVNVTWFPYNGLFGFILNNLISDNRLHFENLVVTFYNINLEIFSFYNRLNNRVIDDFC